MVNTDIVKFLSEIDTSIFLSFNGIHSPFLGLLYDFLHRKDYLGTYVRNHLVYPA